MGEKQKPAWIKTLKIDYILSAEGMDPVFAQESYIANFSLLLKLFSNRFYDLRAWVEIMECCILRLCSLSVNRIIKKKKKWDSAEKK